MTTIESIANKMRLLGIEVINYNTFCIVYRDKDTGITAVRVGEDGISGKWRLDNLNRFTVSKHFLLVNGCRDAFETRPTELYTINKLKNILNIYNVLWYRYIIDDGSCHCTQALNTNHPVILFETIAGKLKMVNYLGTVVDISRFNGYIKRKSKKLGLQTAILYDKGTDKYVIGGGTVDTIGFNQQLEIITQIIEPVILIDKDFKDASVAPNMAPLIIK